MPTVATQSPTPSTLALALAVALSKLAAAISSSTQSPAAIIASRAEVTAALSLLRDALGTAAGSGTAMGQIDVLANIRGDRAYMIYTEVPAMLREWEQGWRRFAAEQGVRR